MLTSNVRCNIVAPRFCNLKLYNDGFKVSVSLNISLAIYNELGSNLNYKPIEYKSRYYLHWEKSYHYGHTRFDEAFEEAWQAVRIMKIIIRQQKVDLLNQEIDDIQSFEH